MCEIIIPPDLCRMLDRIIQTNIYLCRDGGIKIEGDMTIDEYIDATSRLIEHYVENEQKWIRSS